MSTNKKTAVGRKSPDGGRTVTANSVTWIGWVSSSVFELNTEVDAVGEDVFVSTIL